MKAEKDALQWAAFEKQQKEIEKHQDIIRRLTGGAQSGRAASAWIVWQAWRRNAVYCGHC